MSNVTEKTGRILTGVTHAVEALEAIGVVAKDLTASNTVDQAVRAGRVIGTLVQTVLSGLAGLLSPQQVQEELDQFRASMSDNDRKVQDALDAKFPPSSEK
jgi:hypothetical protein